MKWIVLWRTDDGASNQAKKKSKTATTVGELRAQLKKGVWHDSWPVTYRTDGAGRYYIMLLDTPLFELTNWEEDEREANDVEI